MSPLAERIEIHLLHAGGFVPTRDLCEHFAITERSLRQTGDKQGLLDDFAVSSSAQGSNGYIHHSFLPTDQWLPIKHRLRRHALSELRRAKKWAQSRHNILTGRRPDLREKFSGQGLLFGV